MDKFTELSTEELDQVAGGCNCCLPGYGTWTYLSTQVRDPRATDVGQYLRLHPNGGVPFYYKGALLGIISNAGWFPV